MWATNLGGWTTGKVASRQAKGWRPGVGLPHTVTFWSGTSRSLRRHLECGYLGYFGGDTCQGWRREWSYSAVCLHNSKLLSMYTMVKWASFCILALPMLRVDWAGFGPGGSMDLEWHRPGAGSPRGAAHLPPARPSALLSEAAAASGHAPYCQPHCVGRNPPAPLAGSS